jgi:hypothetical protein
MARLSAQVCHGVTGWPLFARIAAHRKPVKKLSNYFPKASYKDVRGQGTCIADQGA